MPASEPDIEAVYFRVLERWNARDATGFTGLFVPDGYCIGFDGSELVGREGIDSTLRAIFAHHQTGTYVGKVRSVRIIDDVALVHAVVGMVPAGQQDLNPELNAIQTLVASRTGGAWRVEVLQNTPAAFHGRPEAREALTQELRALLRR
jgi:uncharacterized protein (TIGR02246 family)